MLRSQQDLIKIMANGGCLDLKVGRRTQQDLVHLGAIARTHAARIVLREVGMKSTTDLIQIALNAPGLVTFVIDD